MGTLPEARERGGGLLGDQPPTRFTFSLSCPVLVSVCTGLHNFDSPAEAQIARRLYSELRLFVHATS